MSILNLDEAKLYLHVDYEDDDSTIKDLIDAAEIYLINAGCNINEQNTVMFKLAEKMLVSHWYNNREPTGSATKLVYGFQSIIIQLRYCYPENSDNT
ncbi:head-tail connector protein [Clostridium tyrobutyricum]|uniref:head-tail connector protein n=1 Tax=Clostridium tyrobutyricum TaxID=1519 RepID=UPI001C391626|nr:head-tail connector protein [Clostridium tyrobutyricum]MBV4417201.1 head-tail connector protein [Clostridium tyrobutyricum]